MTRPKPKPRSRSGPTLTEDERTAAGRERMVWRPVAGTLDDLDLVADGESRTKALERLVRDEVKRRENR